METKQSMYIESTIPSYATAKRSANALNLLRRAQTRAFWDNERHKYRLWISQAVLNECAKGDAAAARRRLDYIKGIEIIREPEGLEELAETYQALLGIPDKAATDCTHLAYCVLFCIDLLLTWNCTHLGLPTYLRLREYNEAHKLWTPLLVTPETIYNLKEKRYE